jgi:hypothetical protein
MNVLVMRRKLTIDELSALKHMFPDQEIHEIRIDPKSADHHLLLCRDNRADLVFLPHEIPIPVPAMREGFKHLQLKDGRLQELVRVIPEFEDYRPAE